MTFTAADRNLSHIAKALPPDAMEIWCEAANKATDDGADHNGAVQTAWGAVAGAGYHRPNGSKRWTKRSDTQTVHITIGKADPGPSDVHVDAPLGSAPPKKKPRRPSTAIDSYASGDDEEDIGDQVRNLGMNKSAVIVKADDEQRMVYGWASVISEKGEPVVDTQDDVIEPAEMEKATTEFMSDARMAKAMHEGDGIGEVLHSFPLTAELAKLFGIQCEKEGWMVGVKVRDDATWSRVKDGSLAAFSIGGAGARIPI